MADDERSAAAGQHDTQARADAETEGGNVAAPQDATPMVATEITPQSPVQSMSSRGGDNMQTSQPSLQSGTGEGGERPQSERLRASERDGQRRNRPPVSRLDYGMLMPRCRIQTKRR